MPHFDELTEDVFLSFGCGSHFHFSRWLFDALIITHILFVTRGIAKKNSIAYPAPSTGNPNPIALPRLVAMPQDSISQNIFDFGDNCSPVQQAREALLAARQYQRDWQEVGRDRVYKYFDDVEGDWLEEFESIAIEQLES